MKKLEGKIILKLFLLSLAIAFVIAYTFATDFFPKNSKELISHKKTYRSIIVKRDLALNKAIELKNINMVSEIINSSNKKLKEYTKEKNRLLAKDSFIGYTSFKYFLLGTSNRLLSFVISIFFLFIIVKHVKKSLIKKYYLITSFVFVVTSGYWFSWSLLFFLIDPNRGFDFPKSWYYVSIYVLPSFIFFAAYYLFEHYATIEEKLKNGIKLLINHISVYTFNIIPEKKKKEVFIKNLETYEKLVETIKK